MTSDLTIVLSQEDAFGFRYDRNHCAYRNIDDKVKSIAGNTPEVPSRKPKAILKVSCHHCLNLFRALHDLWQLTYPFITSNTYLYTCNKTFNSIQSKKHQNVDRVSESSKKCKYPTEVQKKSNCELEHWSASESFCQV